MPVIKRSNKALENMAIPKIVSLSFVSFAVVANHRSDRRWVQNCKLSAHVYGRQGISPFR